METRKCTKCNEEQNVENFYVRKKGSEKRCSDCKKCQSKQKATKINIVADLEGEIWKDIVGLEGFVLVSNLARIKRIMHRKNPTNKILSPFVNTCGYHQVSICHKGKYLTPSLHRTVALAFIPNPENKPEVNHKDGNKKNNQVENLEWCTSKENILESWRMGLSKARDGEKHHNSKLTEKEVLEIRAIGKTMSAKEIGGLYGVNEQAIYKILKRIRWKNI